jgi:hypothetical protein
MRFTVKVEWKQADGTVGTTELGSKESYAQQSAPDVGLALAHTISL